MDRAELHSLVDALPDTQVQSAIEQMRSRIRPPRLVGAKPLAWIAGGPANNNRTDNATRISELLADEFGR